MKTKLALFLVTLMVGFSSKAGIGSSEFGDGWKTTKLSAESFYSRFALQSEIFILDNTGKKLRAPTTETREWKPSRKSHKIEASWKVGANGFKLIAMHVEWELKADNSIETLIQQFDDISSDPNDPKAVKFGKLIREERKVLENFAPVTWVAEESPSTRVVIRFTPVIDNVRESESIGKLAIGGDRGTFTVMDNQGYLWGDNVRMGGVVSGITCHRGSLVISYYPFKGGKELGSAQGKIIELNLTDDLNVKIRSETDLIPGEMRVKVYGKYLPNVKSPSPSSTTSFGQDSFDKVDKELRQ